MAKVMDYLLSLSHPAGRTKAAFFIGLGFSIQDPDPFIAELKRMAVEAEVKDRITGPFGTKYVVEGEMAGPGGAASVRTIWFVRVKWARPRLVTAYPSRAKE